MMVEEEARSMGVDMDIDVRMMKDVVGCGDMIRWRDSLGGALGPTR